MRISAKIAIYIFVILLIFLFGTFGTYVLGHYDNGFNVRINSLIDAAYFTVITVSTVGYGDIYPVSRTAKIFVMVLVVVGLGVFLSAVSVLSSDFVTERIERISGRPSSIERRLLKNHVVLIGADTVNANLAERLKSKNIKFVMITADKSTMESLRDRGYRAYIADETDERDMMLFELGKAKSIVLDMRDKSRMVYAVLVVRNLAKDSRIVIVAHNKEEERNARKLGAGIGIINPANLASEILSKKIMELKA